jgi:N-formylglutamate deformylase
VGTFGQPARGLHSVQIELNRALYLDEAQGTRSANFAVLRANLASVIRDFCGICRKTSLDTIDRTFA